MKRPALTGWFRLVQLLVVAGRASQKLGGIQHKILKFMKKTSKVQLDELL